MKMVPRKMGTEERVNSKGGHSLEDKDDHQVNYDNAAP